MDPVETMSVQRARLERLVSAATAFVAFQRMRQGMGLATGVPARVTIDGLEQSLSAATIDAEIDVLEQDVIYMRRALGWRR